MSFTSVSKNSEMRCAYGVLYLPVCTLLFLSDVHVCVCRERVGDPPSGWHHPPRSHQTVSAGSGQKMGKTSRKESKRTLNRKDKGVHCFLCFPQGEFKVTERNMGMKELLEALDAGRIMEVFGAGTACVVCPVGSLLYKGKVALS